VAKAGVPSTIHSNEGFEFPKDEILEEAKDPWGGIAKARHFRMQFPLSFYSNFNFQLIDSGNSGEDPR